MLLFCAFFFFFWLLIFLLRNPNWGVELGRYPQLLLFSLLLLLFFFFCMWLSLSPSLHGVFLFPLSWPSLWASHLYDRHNTTAYQHTHTHTHTPWSFANQWRNQTNLIKYTSKKGEKLLIILRVYPTSFLCVCSPSNSLCLPFFFYFSARFSRRVPFLWVLFAVFFSVVSGFFFFLD